MTASEIEKALLAAGWHRRKFSAMGVVAMNPYYEDFSLGIADRWLNAGQLSKNLRLWIFPTHDTLLETMEGIMTSDEMWLLMFLVVVTLIAVVVALPQGW